MPVITKHTDRPWMPKKQPFARKHSNQKFYSSPEWRRCRAAFLAVPEHMYCAECKKHGVFTSATVVDHIVPINQGGASLSFDNLQPLCAKCHNIKSAKENK